MNKMLRFILSVAVLLSVLSVNVVSFADTDNQKVKDEITYSFDEASGELTVEGYGMYWSVNSIQYSLDFLHNIDETDVKKLLVKDGLTILDCHCLVGALYEWENLVEMTLPKSIKMIRGDLSKFPSLKTINYAGTGEEWNKIKFRDNLKGLFDKMNFNYSVEVPESESGFEGKGNETVSVKIMPDKKITCTLDCITEKLVVSGKGNLYLSPESYDANFSVSSLFTRGYDQDDAWTPYISDIVIEDGITKLCEYNFNSVYNSVVIPKSVTEIEENCFGSHSDNIEAVDNIRESDNKKMNVYYEGSAEEWSRIKIGDYNDDLVNANINCGYSVNNEIGKSSGTPVVVLTVSAVALFCAATAIILTKKKKNK